MSADNWIHCPRCAKLAEKEIKNALEKVDAAYGNVSFEEFDALVKVVAEMRRKNEDARMTFREDYEFYGAETGVVFVEYSGHCTKCDLSMKISENYLIPGL